MSTVKVGQVWRDKDKRRNTVIEILSVATDKHGSAEAIGLVVGTEETRSYNEERLVKRWELVQTKNPTITDDPTTDEGLEEVKPKHKNREAWLGAAVKEVSKLFKAIDHEVPTVRVSVGWPGGRGKKQGVIGQCFATTSATDKVAQIFVSPVVVEPIKTLVVVAHELVHAVDDCKSGHKSGFIKIARELGFTPKWTVATPETISEELREKLEAIAEKLGSYPHAAIVPSERPVVQKTYMLKVLCVEDPSYFIRMTSGKIEEYGTPLCPCHHLEMEVEEK